MISAFFIFNQKGEVLISRLFRNDLRRSIADIFRIQVVSNPDVRSPIITLGSTSFFHVRHENLYIVAVTKCNANAALVFEFCYRVITIGRSYFGGKFDEEAVKNNFVLIYELLDEILDFGYPQNSEIDTLKMYITTEGVKSEQAVREDSSKITIQATGATSWRRADVKYRKNEAFVDVVETVNLLMSSKGTILRADVDGAILMRAYLTGMPECRFGLNDKLVLEKNDKNKGKVDAVELDDCQFHQCVKLGKYDTDRSISFIPPDGEFELMRYRSTTNVNLPFKVHAIVEEISKSKVEYTLNLKANFDTKLSATNVVLRIPTPLNTSTVKCQVSMGKAKYVPAENHIVWKIARIQGGGEASFGADAELSSTTVRKAWSRPPIEVDFQVLMFTSSGLLVRYLKVFEKSNYQSVKWIIEFVVISSFAEKWDAVGVDDVGYLRIDDGDALIDLASTSGTTVDLFTLSLRTPIMLFLYPSTASPLRATPASWSTIPGATGCTPHLTSVNSHLPHLLSKEPSLQIFGLSTQSPTEQLEAKTRLNLNFHLLSDESQQLREILDIPTFECEGKKYFKRMTLLLRGAPPLAPLAAGSLLLPLGLGASSTNSMSNGNASGKIQYRIVLPRIDSVSSVTAGRPRTVILTVFSRESRRADGKRNTHTHLLELDVLIAKMTKFKLIGALIRSLKLWLRKAALLTRCNIVESCTVSNHRPDMGIQGLLPLLKDVQRPVHVSSYAGKTLGVDAYVWLHRGAYGCAREIVLGDPTPRYIAHALSRIRMLQHFGVKPYLVFDGDKLPAKKGTEDDREQRRSDNLQRAKELEQEGKSQQARDVYGKCVDITPEMAFQLIKVLKEENIPYVVAPYEADAQLAYLEAQGIIDGVVTEDSDLLVFGCKTVLFKLDQAGNAVEMLQHRFWTNRHITLSGWTAVEFRQMAILSGCDYLPSIVGMGLKNAHRLLRRYKTVDKVLQAVRLEGKMRIPPTYSREFRKAELTFVHQRVFDPRSQKLVTLTPLPDGTHDDMLPFIGAPIEDQVARGIAEGIVDPISRTHIVDRVPKPLGVRSNSANNIASTSASASAAGEVFSLTRSTTAPVTLGQNGVGGIASSSGNSFYRSGVGATSSFAKKKVVSKEAGLQSLKNFFGGPSPSNGSAKSNVSVVKEERVALAPRDMNRQNGVREEVKAKAEVSKQGQEARPTQSKFFASRRPSQDAKLDHAYLHLGGQLTPPRARQDPNDSGYWDDECDDMRDFVKSSSPVRAPSVAPESQALVMNTQELWQSTQVAESRVQSVVATQMVPSTDSASVVVPQTPSKGRKRMFSASTESEAVLSSPESAIGSGLISSPASSSVRGGGEDSSVKRVDAAGGLETDALPSSPLLPMERKPSVSDEEDDVEAIPMTPLAARSAGARKPMLHTSASMSKLEAFRYTTHTPRQQQEEPQRVTLPRRSTDAATTTLANTVSPSVLKLAASARTPAAAQGTRPNKVLKRSPTLLLDGEEGDVVSRGGRGGGGGLFDRFRFTEATGGLTRGQVPF
ncbi:hypothetical protein PHSY_002822 [Pseudozyma hubeiensis SY62]|uniref:MHD domain-containing protein n=1 Tax=Pseudozyma hubeiensis (strain SY62) TaxID=1305764 RepID=R9P227_PSEHS|nr:hypothetical protein PHSY_002822 [Pseudozyma hubeiensis SY62]GAC95247.1 hypothetical protein PHSY_002822 [Pseudozyma hubeiensis SY62]